MTTDRWYIDPDRVVWEVIEGEAVIVDLAAGHYHAATGVAATVWQAVAAGVDLDRIVAAVGAAHTEVPGDAHDQVVAFLASLESAGLVRRTGEPGADASPPQGAGSPTPWEAPRLESHDDLEDLLLLDPVHDVTSAGWPNAAAPVAE